MLQTLAVSGSNKQASNTNSGSPSIAALTANSSTFAECPTKALKCCGNVIGPTTLIPFSSAITGTSTQAP